jgi:hypothetical protein
MRRFLICTPCRSCFSSTTTTTTITTTTATTTTTTTTTIRHLQPLRVWAASFWRFRDNTQGRTTVGRTPLDEWSALRRNLYLRNTQHGIQVLGWRNQEGWHVHVARMEVKRCVQVFGGDRIQDQGVDERIIWKWVFSMIWSVLGCCAHGDETLGSIKFGNSVTRWGTVSV